MGSCKRIRAINRGPIKIIFWFFYLLFYICTGLLFNSCGTPYELIDRNGLKEGQQISKIILVDGTLLVFSDDPLHYAFYKSGKIERFTSQGKIEHYDPNSIESFYFYDGGLDSKAPALWIISGTIFLIVSYMLLLKY